MTSENLESSGQPEPKEQNTRLFRIVTLLIFILLYLGVVLAFIILLLSQPRSLLSSVPMEASHRWLVGVIVSSIGVLGIVLVCLLPTYRRVRWNLISQAADLCFFLAVLSIGLGVLMGGTLKSGLLPGAFGIAGYCILKILAKLNKNKNRA